MKIGRRTLAWASWIIALTIVWLFYVALGLMSSIPDDLFPLAYGAFAGLLADWILERQGYPGPKPHCSCGRMRHEHCRFYGGKHSNPCCR